MKNKVKSITEKVPQIAVLPDGFYNGIWGGYIIEISCNGKQYELATEMGVKGIGIKVIVDIRDGIATFDTMQS